MKTRRPSKDSGNKYKVGCLYKGSRPECVVYFILADNNSVEPIGDLSVKFMDEDEARMARQIPIKLDALELYDIKEMADNDKIKLRLRGLLP